MDLSFCSQPIQRIPLKDCTNKSLQLKCVLIQNYQNNKLELIILGVRMVEATQFPLDDPLLYSVWDSHRGSKFISQEPKNNSSSLAKLSLRYIFTFIYQIPAKGIGYIVAAIALKYFCQPLSPPFWGLAAGMIAGRTVIRILETCNCCCKDLVKTNSLALVRRFPGLQLTGVIFALVIGLFTVPVGIGIGGAIGFIGGLTVSVEHTLYRQRQNAQIRKLEEAKGPYQLGKIESIR